MQYNRDYTGSSNYDPCASDNSMSGCYENNKRIDNGLNYGIIGKNINNLNEGTIYILKLIEEKGYNRDGNIRIESEKDRDRFLQRFGLYLQDISNQLYELGAAKLYYSKWDDIIISKMTIKDMKSKQISFYYESDKMRDDKFSIDMKEMLNSEFRLYKFSPVMSEIRHGGIVQGWSEWINKGYIATFIKKINQ